MALNANEGMTLNSNRRMSLNAYLKVGGSERLWGDDSECLLEKVVLNACGSKHL